MNITDSQIDRLRTAFRGVNRFMLLMWRLGLGRSMAGPQRGYVMVLVTTGRKSGLRRLAPLNFAADPGAVYCIAGFGKTTHWLINLLADPSCEVWLPDGRRMHGTGELVTDETERIEIVRRVLIRAGFAAKLFEPEVDPFSASDEQIADLGERYGRRYEAVRIDLDGTVTGPGGPGDLAWVPVVTVALAAAGGVWAVLKRLEGP